MKIIFAGTPEFSVPTLQALLPSSHKIVAVLTQPDRPAGRGQKLQPSPVKVLAEQYQLPIFQPKTLRDAGIQNIVRDLQPDVMIVVAYGLILPEAVLKIPKYGCINIHPSLLPRWRGAAPIQRTIEAGDRETAITIMQMDKGMDSGPILKQEMIALRGDETSTELHEVLSHRGAVVLIETLKRLETITPKKQDHSKATHAKKLEKSESVIDWRQPVAVIERKIRAFNPWPGAIIKWKGLDIKIWSATILSRSHAHSPGAFFTEDDHLYVAASDGALEILTLQLSGKRIMSARDFIHGNRDIDQ